MISNLTTVTFGVNIAIALSIIVVFVLKYRKSEGFGQAVLWGVLTYVVSNFIRNIIGSQLFPNGIDGSNPFLGSLLNSLLITVSVVVAYLLISRFQANKGTNKKTPVMNAFAFIIIPTVNVIMQSINYIMYISAINAGNASQFVSETFTQAQLDDLISKLTTAPSEVYLQLGLTILIELAVMIVVFTILFKARKEEGGYNIKPLIVGTLVVLIYYFTNILIQLIVPSVILIHALHLLLGTFIFIFFYKVLDL